MVDDRLVQGHDPRMRQPGGGARLAFEATADDPLAGDDLDRHLSIQTLVPRHPHGSERPGAEAAMEAVALEHERSLRTRALAMLLSGSPNGRAVGSWLALIQELFHAARAVPAGKLALRPIVGTCTTACDLAFPAVAPVILAFNRSPQGARNCRSSTRRTSLAQHLVPHRVDVARRAPAAAPRATSSRSRCAGLSPRSRSSSC